MKVSKFAFVTVGCILACLLFEGLLRITDPTDFNRFYNDPNTGLLTYPHNYSFTQAQPCFSNTVFTNSNGLHAPDLPTTNKKSDEFRIVIVGSSFAEAVDEPIEQTPAGALEHTLNADPDRKWNYRVYSTAFSGNNTYLDILYYLSYGRLLQPDLVIDITTEYEAENSLHATYPPQFDSKGELVTTLPPKNTESFTANVKHLLRQSKLVMNLNDRYVVFKANLTAPQTNDEFSAAGPSDEALNMETKLYSYLQRFVREDNASLLVASWTTPQTSSSTQTRLNENIQRAANLNRFYYVNMKPYFSAQEIQTGQSPSWSCDGHWSPVGTQWVAELIAQYLQTHPELLKK